MSRYPLLLRFKHDLITRELKFKDSHRLYLNEQAHWKLVQMYIMKKLSKNLSYAKTKLDFGLAHEVTSLWFPSFFKMCETGSQLPDKSFYNNFFLVCGFCKTQTCKKQSFLHLQFPGNVGIKKQKNKRKCICPQIDNNR